jgi:O-methyltransferase
MRIKPFLKSALLPVRSMGATFFHPLREDSVLWKAAQLCFSELVEGDYLEFGVSRGDSFVHAINTVRHVYRWYATNTGHTPHQRRRAQEIRDGMRFFAFDSFCGLPAPKGVDRHSRDFTERQFAFSLGAFLDRVRRNGIDVERVVAVPGWFHDTCTRETIGKYQMKAASIVHVDCDLYESARVVLKFVEPLLVDGSILIFDDWYCFRGNPELGEQRAFREWAPTKSGWIFTEYQKEGAWANSFLANRRGRQDQGLSESEELGKGEVGI